MIRFINNMINADKNDAKADSLNIKAFNRKYQAEQTFSEQRRTTQDSIEKLASRKTAILKTSFKKFLAVYEKVKKINFTESDGIRKIESLGLNNVQIESLREMVAVSTQELTTGQAITTMIVKGGFSGIVRKESEMNLHAASMRTSQARIIEQQVAVNCEILGAIADRANRFADLISKLNLLFLKSILTTEKIIDERGFIKSNYTREDRDKLATCFNIAFTVKKVIDVPLLDSNGELEKASIEAIDMGNTYLNKMNNLVGVH